MRLISGMELFLVGQFVMWRQHRQYVVGQYVGVKVIDITYSIDHVTSDQ